MIDDVEPEQRAWDICRFQSLRSGVCLFAERLEHGDFQGMAQLRNVWQAPNKLVQGHRIVSQADAGCVMNRVRDRCRNSA